jgi:4-hydroxy-tetrahydrodipicolinate synthase
VDPDTLTAMAQIEGVLTALATPFDPEGAVDEAASRRLAAYLVENGSHGVVVAGSTGEAATLDDSEHIALLRAVVAEIGDAATVICGTGTNDTRHSVELTRAAADAGAEAALIVTPYYNKPTPAGIVAHFEAISEAVPDLPLIAYNIPSRVVINVPPDLLAELGRIDNVVAVKQANNDDLRPIDGLGLLAGNDEIFLRTIEVGGAGGILVASHLAGPQMREIWEAARAGDMERAREIDESLQPLYEMLGMTTNPIPLKAALEMTGLIPSGGLRLPLVPADAEQRFAIEAALDRAGIATRLSR